MSYPEMHRKKTLMWNNTHYTDTGADASGTFIFFSCNLTDYNSMMVFCVVDYITIYFFIPRLTTGNILSWLLEALEIWNLSFIQFYDKCVQLVLNVARFTNKKVLAAVHLLHSILLNLFL